MNLQSIYHYTNPRQYLLDYLSARQLNEKTFSVRKWAKEMELKSHSLLVMLLQGKRQIRIQHSHFLLRGLSFTLNESAYFEAIIQYQNAKTIEEKTFIAKLMNELNPGREVKTKEVLEFKIISGWVHMAIMAMTELKDFRGTETEIHRLLAGKLTLSEIRAALTRLLDMELLKWDEVSRLVPTFNQITTRDDIQNEGAKEYHRQVMALAANAIDKQKLEEREFQSFTMAIAKEKIPMAKEMIRRFRRKLSQAVSGEGDEVYQTSIQFFRLTENSKPNSFDAKSVAQDTSKNNAYKGAQLC
ncbi:MAG: TIGR02147 family protein [Bacteriovoracaceae bacterium]|jgi:uncharacterized protein (TIGR02147 family)|nr:TIGR02147 family protein [Bacteriovoracaceae bacterium]